jgi:hypothetical protein
MDCLSTPDGSAFGSHRDMTDAKAEPNRSKREKQLAIKTRDA